LFGGSLFGKTEFADVKSESGSATGGGILAQLVVNRMRSHKILLTFMGLPASLIAR
jgi:hypothetical protein